MTEFERYFIFKVKKELEKRLDEVTYPIDKEEYRARLDYEIKVILQMNFANYFLVVQDYIRWSKEQGILVGPGRGSAAGSLVCWALGITGIAVDPIRYGLYFERFLNPDRVSYPDVDTDFPKEGREKVIEYIKEKYGSDKVAQIGTLGTFKAKRAIRGVAKTLGIEISVADRLTKLYPKPQHGKEVKIKEALANDLQLSRISRSDTAEGEILRWAEKMEGREASFGIHASGTLISDAPLYKYVPLAKGKRNEVVTQWDMNHVEEIGLIKFDLLGLKTLDQISTTLSYIKKRRDLDIDLDTIPLDDDEVFANLRSGDNIGIFQLETSSGMRDLMVKQGPRTLEDLAALVAIFRPGPLASKHLITYLQWRAGEIGPVYHHPDLEPILRETGGFAIYQENILQIARDLAGYTLAEADLLRRAVGKKKEDEMAQQYAGFSSGMQKNGYSLELIETLWEEINAFASYAFNKSHALAYGLISYWSAYLKTHYPVEFMAASLTCDSGNMDQMITYLQECKKMGIEVLPPDVNESEASFYPVGENKIRFGFSAVKNLGTVPANHIGEIRTLRPFIDFFDFCRRVDLGLMNKKKLESLVLAGAFDFTGKNRATLLQAVDTVLQHKEFHKRYLKKMETWEKKSEAYAQRLEDIKNNVLSEKGKPLKPLKLPEKPETLASPSYIELPEMDKREILQQEKNLMGFYISGHPLDDVSLGNMQISDLKTEQPAWITLVGVISELNIRETRNKKRMASGRIEDLTGTVEMVMFPQVYEKNKDLLLVNTPLRITAKIDYIEPEMDEDSIEEHVQVIPNLLVNSIELLQASSPSSNYLFNVPLTLENIEKVNKLLEKHTGETDTVTLRFITEREDWLISSKEYKVANGKSFRTEIYRELNT